MGKHEEAIIVYHKANSVYMYSSYLDAYLSKVSTFVAIKKYEDARSEFHNAIFHNPDDVNALHYEDLVMKTYHYEDLVMKPSRYNIYSLYHEL